MTNKDLQETIAALKKVTEENTTSPEKALALLVKMGIATKGGKLTKQYRQNA